MRRLAVVLAALVAFVATPPSPAGAAAPAAVAYRPPVDAPVVDPFRAPAENWNAGNRGLEYATAAGSPVAAAAAGRVVFAGPVAGGLHVVVLHDDGLRTSYSFLQTVSVRRGDTVRQGQQVGTSNERLHFGVRAGDAYLDPARLFGGGPPEVHLVPDELRRLQTETEERDGLARMFRGWGSRIVDGGAEAYRWARDFAERQVEENLDELRGAIHFVGALDPAAHVRGYAVAAHDWWKARDTCTPTTVATPRLKERHLLVRVAGMGSTGEKGVIDDVDAAALGYADADVFRFSYRGGTVAENRYGAHDTTNDLRESGRHLRELLARLEREHPGVPIDIVAHSQGGLVARSALSEEGEAGDGHMPKVSSLVTLGSPHLGTPVATGLTMFGHTTVGELVLTGAHAVLPDKIDPAGTSVTQMAEHSEFLRRLNSRPLPAGVKVTSIGAREDLAVPATRTALAGAHNVIVSAPGLLQDHDRLPGSVEAQREIALGLAGMTPTCQSFSDAMADAAVSQMIAYTETGLGATAYLAGRAIDKKAGQLFPSPTIPKRYDVDPPS
jgi:hypothetical protein